MKKTAISALALIALAGTAFADPHEAQTFAGPYQTYGSLTNDYGDDSNPLNSTVTVTFTGAGYSPNGLLLSMDLQAIQGGTYASEVALTVIPPSGPAYIIFPAFATDGYTTLTGVTYDFPLPSSIQPVGTWTFVLWDEYGDVNANNPQSAITNLTVALSDSEVFPAAPADAVDLGTLNGADITSSVPDFVGGEVRWWKIVVPSDATAENGLYVDIDTFGTDVAINPGDDVDNDTEIGIYDDRGYLFWTNDDMDLFGDVFESAMTFGATGPRTHGDSPFVYDGSDGTLYGGTYYIAAGHFNLDFAGDFDVTNLSAQTSPGGTLVVNVFNNFEGAPTSCSPADVGVAGGIAGQDRRLDNNDFIAFINFFFAQNAAADLGIAGGLPGHDGAWDNNDFIAFINYFFNDSASCTG